MLSDEGAAFFAVIHCAKLGLIVDYPKIELGREPRYGQ